MKDQRLRTAAATAWIFGLVITGALLDVDWHLGLVLLGGGAFILAGVASMYRCSRETRRAVFQQRRWTDKPEDYPNVVNLR